MGSVTCHQAISLDGFTAGLHQSVDQPFGDGGSRLTDWIFETDEPDRGSDGEILAEVMRNVGAFVMGRNMFGGGHGPWDESWTGWWGDEPPYHAPVFVLTHHERQPLPKQGGTTFTFVTDGVESALKQARAAAGDKEVAVAGGAHTVRQFLAAGLLDQLYLHIVPVLLGAGERLLENVGDPALEIVDVTASPTVTHVKYRVVH